MDKSKLELRDSIMERFNDVECMLQKAKEDFDDYDVQALSENELRAVLAEASNMQEYIKGEAIAVQGILDADKVKLDTVTLRLQGVHMCLDDCKARLYGCLDILYNKPLEYTVPNLTEIDEMSKQLRAKVKELYDADLGKLLTTVRVLP